jgi:hypothetical protein
MFLTHGLNKYQEEITTFRPPPGMIRAGGPTVVLENQTKFLEHRNKIQAAASGNADKFSEVRNLHRYITSLFFDRMLMLVRCCKIISLTLMRRCASIVE